ncbi:MAG: TraR/DksA C4-type zinc finger protein [Idiomarina sp.]
MSLSLSAQQLARIRTKLETRRSENPPAAKAAALEAALERIANGEYGYCVECGDEISAARLSMKPEVALCSDCQALKDEEDDSNA